MKRTTSALLMQNQSLPRAFPSKTKQSPLDDFHQEGIFFGYIFCFIQNKIQAESDTIYSVLAPEATCKIQRASTALGVPSSFTSPTQRILPTATSLAAAEINILPNKESANTRLSARRMVFFIFPNFFQKICTLTQSELPVHRTPSAKSNAHRLH